MAEPDAKPNAFDQFDDEKPKANPFDQFDDQPNEKIVAPHSSLGGAVTRSALRSTAPALGGLAAMGAGAEAGAALGGALGSVVPGAGTAVGGAVGGVVGGLGGMFLGSAAVDAAQDWALRQLPDSWRDSLGMTDQQQRLDESQHPIGSFIGATIPYAVAMRPSNIFKGAALPENATSIQHLMANPVTKALVGGGAMGGLELGQEAVHGDVDWRKVAISTGFGVIFNKPTRFGQRITETGAAPMRALGERIGNYAGPSLTGPMDFRIPTVAEVGDTKVMGPGITEEVFQGSNQQDPASEATAQQTARAEQQVLGTGPAAAGPDIGAMARRMEPEAFAQYDALKAQRDEFDTWIREQSNPTNEMLQPVRDQIEKLTEQYSAHVESRNGYRGGPEARRLRAQILALERQSNEMIERRKAWLEGTMQDTPEMTQVRQRRMAVDEQMRDLAPDVSAALRRASEAVGNGLVPPPEAPAAAASVAPVAGAPAAASAGPSIEAQKASIAADVVRQLTAAGRGENAQASAAIVAAYYVRRAARFGGKLGTPLELYQREGAEIRGPNGRRAPPAPATPAAAAPAGPAGAVPAARAPEPAAAAPAAPECS